MQREPTTGMGYRFKAKETIADGVRRIANEQLTKALDELDDRRLGPHETIHQARKRCKKVRALLRLARPALAGDTYAFENAWYRDTGREIATIRDAQTRIETVDALRREYGRLVSEEVFGRVRSALVARREALLADRVSLQCSLDEVCERLEEGLQRVDDWKLEDDGFEALRGGLVQRYQRGRSALRTAYDEPSAEHLHEWRKRVKDHRYHVRLLAPVWPGPMQARQHELHALSDLLGEDHDLFVLESFASQEPKAAGGEDVVRVVLALALGRRMELRTAARSLGARLFAEKPKRVADRIGAWFETWKAEAPERAKVVHEPRLVRA